MNPKIEKMKAEAERNSEKINALTERNVLLKAKITELENLDIIGLVRERQISPADLEAVFGVKPKNDGQSGDEQDE